MLNSLFTSEARIKILDVLLFRAEKGLHLREIARRTGVIPTYAKKELERLAETGIVNFSKVGNLNVFAINKGCPIFKELRSIFLKTYSFVYLAATRLKKFDAEYALVYGSFAAAAEKPASDIDLLIVGNVEEAKVSAIISRMEEDAGREVNYILWSREEFRKKIAEKNKFLLAIIKKPFQMIIGEENEFRSAVERRAH